MSLNWSWKEKAGEFKKIVFYRSNISNKDIAVISDLLSKAFPNIEISSIFYK